MSHPSFDKAADLYFHMLDYASEHGRNLGHENVQNITGHLKNAMSAIEAGKAEHNKQPYSASAMLELTDAGHHLNQAAKSFDIRDDMGQRVDYPLTTDILQAQMGEHQHEFVSDFANDMNKGRNNGRKY
jgi:hypothetical protein